MSERGGLRAAPLFITSPAEPLDPELNRRLSSLLLAVLAAALIASGCGGGDSSSNGSSSSSSTPSGTALSKDEFISKADQICAEGDAQIDKGGQAFAGTKGGKVDELVNTVIAPGLRNEIDQLRKLTPPEGDQAAVKDFLDTLERGVDQMEADPTQLAGGAALDTIIKARGLALAYGMSSCARGAKP
jgi:hypothetical protein